MSSLSKKTDHNPVDKHTFWWYTSLCSQNVCSFCLFHYVQGDFTMRKKKKMSAVITLILFCGCFLFGSFLSFAQNSRTEEPVQFKCYKSIVIQEGDSLWSLAERHIDSESETAVKEYIKELKQINQLESETIQTGEHLIIPYYTTEFPQ